MALSTSPTKEEEISFREIKNQIVIETQQEILIDSNQKPNTKSKYCSDIEYNSSDISNTAVDAEALKCIDELGLRLVGDGYVKWKSDAEAHPRNWSVTRKCFDTGLIVMLDLFT